MYHPLSLYLAKISVCMLQQVPQMTNAQLVDKLRATVEVVEEIGGEFGTDSQLVGGDIAKYLKEIVVEPSDATPSHTGKAKRRA